MPFPCAAASSRTTCLDQSVPDLHGEHHTFHTGMPGCGWWMWAGLGKSPLGSLIAPSVKPLPDALLRSGLSHGQQPPSPPRAEVARGVLGSRRSIWRERLSSLGTGAEAGRCSPAAGACAGNQQHWVYHQFDDSVSDLREGKPCSSISRCRCRNGSDIGSS